MATVNIQQAKARLSKLIARAQAGEEIIIAGQEARGATRSVTKSQAAPAVRRAERQDSSAR